MTRRIVQKSPAESWDLHLLTQRFGGERMVSFRFSRPSQSHLTSQLLSMINNGPLKMCQADEAASLIAEEAWKQLRLMRDTVPAPETMERYIDPSEGHDAVLMSMARLSQALSRFMAPLESGEVRQRRAG
jgi:hypothetical protein